MATNLSTFWTKLGGTIATFFQFGLSGTGFKPNGTGILEHRLADDSQFAVLRAADPLAPDDVATKRYVDDQTSDLDVEPFRDSWPGVEGGF